MSFDWRDFLCHLKSLFLGRGRPQPSWNSNLHEVKQPMFRRFRYGIPSAGIAFHADALGVCKRSTLIAFPRSLILKEL